MFLVVKDVYYHLFEIIWNFYKIVTEPKYIVMWIYEIFWSSFAIVVIIY
jgi:hypothetical protein